MDVSRAQLPRSIAGTNDENAAPQVNRFGYRGKQSEKPALGRRPALEKSRSVEGLRVACAPLSRSASGYLPQPAETVQPVDLVETFHRCLGDVDFSGLMAKKSKSSDADFHERGHKINEQKKIITDLQEGITQIRRGSKELEQSLAAQQVDCNGTMQRLASEKGQLHDAMSRLQEDVQHKEDQVADLSQRLQQTQMQLEAKEKGNANLEKDKEKLQSDLARTKEEHSRIVADALKSERQERSTEREELQRQIICVKSQLEEKTRNHEQAEQQSKASADAACAQLRQDAEDKYKALERTLMEERKQHEKVLMDTQAKADDAYRQLQDDSNQKMIDAEVMHKHALSKERSEADSKLKQALACAEQTKADALGALGTECNRKLEDLRLKMTQKHAEELAYAEEKRTEAMQSLEASHAGKLNMQEEQAARRLDEEQQRLAKERSDLQASMDKLKKDMLASQQQRVDTAVHEALLAEENRTSRARGEFAKQQTEQLRHKDEEHSKETAKLQQEKNDALKAQKAELERAMQDELERIKGERDQAVSQAKQRQQNTATSLEREKTEALEAQAAEHRRKLDLLRIQLGKQHTEELATVDRKHAEDLSLKQAEVVQAEARLAAKTEEARREAQEAQRMATEQRDAAVSETSKRHAEELAAAVAMKASEAEKRIDELRCQMEKQQIDALANQEQSHKEAVAAQATDAARRLGEACAANVRDQDGALAATERVRAEALASQVQHLERHCRSLEAEKRMLHNMVQELKGNIRVFARVRPAHGTLSEGDLQPILCLADEATLQQNMLCAPSRVGSSDDPVFKEQQFTFNRVFDSHTRQQEVFDEVSPVVQSALDGFKVCLFSYGQTGSGKTHTMLGDSTDEDRGIIPRAVEQILQTAKSYQARGWEYTIEASCVEIYNDTIKDLLSPSSELSEKHSVLFTSENGGCPAVSGIDRIKVTSVESARGIVNRVAANRVTKKTKMNDTSSRSHVVFMMYITGTHRVQRQKLEGFLCFADLAGSERVKNSGVEGAELKEACKINQSLSALGDVFSAIGKNWNFVPFRNSKLTQLLQPCLSGDGKALMFVHVSPDEDDTGESNLSLEFASRVNVCCLGTGGPKKNISALPASSSASSSQAFASRGHPKTPQVSSRSRR